MKLWASQVAQWSRIPSLIQETQELWVLSLGWEDPLGKEMPTRSDIRLGKVPWTEDPGGLQFMGLQRVGYDLVIEPTHTHTHTRNSLCLVSVFIKHLKNLSIISC